MFTIWGLGLSLSWGWQGEDTGTGSMVQRVGGASHRPALNSNAHYFGRKSSVSGPMYVCCEDSSYRRQALKKVQLHNQHSTGPAQRRTRQYWAVTGTRPGCDFFFPYHWRVRLSVYSNFATWMKTNSPALHVRVYVYMYSTCTCTCTHTPTLHTRANCIHVEIVYCTLLCLEVMVSEEREWQKRENDTGLAPRLHHLLPTLKTRKYNTRNKHMRQDLKHFDDESAKCIDCYHAATKNTAE